MSGAAENPTPSPRILLRTSATLLSIASTLIALGLLLGWVTGPLATDDLWWHLTLGDLYAQKGPLLESDPRLHTALSAPHPNAWLFDRALFWIATHGGLGALRAFHGLIVAGIVATLWQALRRTSGSTLWATTGGLLFLALSEYRLVQLRPELASVALCLVVTVLALWSSPASGRWKALALLIAVGLWPHLHPGFPLGVALLGGGAAAAGLDALETKRSGGGDSTEKNGAGSARARMSVLGALALGALALSTFHPSGLDAWASYVSAGREATRSAIVMDEWRALAPFALPVDDLPPARAAWGAWWITTLWTLALTAPLLRERRVTYFQGGWTGLGLAFVGLLAPLVAVRFLWLGFLPLLWIGAQWGPSLRERTGRAAFVALLGACVALTLSLDPRGGGAALRSPVGTIAARTYDADRYYAHALWFLSGTAVEGRLFHPYFMGGFTGFWLGSELSTFADGSLNFPEDVLVDHAAVLQDRPATVGAEDVTELLDRYGVNVFVGVGLPVPPLPGRPWRYSTTLLEDDSRWLLVYRGLRSAVYLRRSPENAANLARIADYYAEQGVPFDVDSGFDADDVLQQAPAWAIEHGAAPRDLFELRRSLETGPPRQRNRARDRLTWVLAVLGEYEKAWSLSSNHRRSDAEARRRSTPRDLWLALKLDRREDALRAAKSLAGADPGAGDALLRAIQDWSSESDPVTRARHARRFVPLDRGAASRIASTEQPATIRSIRDRRRIPPDRYSGSQSNRNPTPNR